MPITAHTYHLPPTPLIPNSPHPLIHYPGLLRETVTSETSKTTDIFDLFASNGWQTQWIARYGPDIQSHYHSTTHECMTVISGQTATIRFGVADASNWTHDETGTRQLGDRIGGEDGGVEIQASIGDVFIIPAGVSHKTFAPRPETRGLAFLQPEDIERGEAAKRLDKGSEERHRQFFADVRVEGDFMMMGAYPVGGTWDFKIGGEHEGREKVVWSVPVPGRDPVLGKSEEGMVGLWK